MGIGRIERLTNSWLRLKARLFTLLLCSQFQECGVGSRISPPFRFGGLHQISLGEGVIISRDCWIQTIEGGDCFSPKLRIGSRSGIGMGASISAAHKIVIGEYVLLGRNVYISDHAHAFEDPDTPIMHQGLNRITPVQIGSETWLGQNVVVLPGVTIGQHCVIGANSVVKTAVPDFSVAVGVPARVVRHYSKHTRQWERVGPA